MAREKDNRYEEIHRSLTHLDLHCHSLKDVGQKLVSKATKPPRDSSDTLYERSLRLSEGCFKIIQDLRDNMEEEEFAACQSALSRIDRAIGQASQAETDTLRIVNTWRVVEAAEQFLTRVSEQYGYVTLSEQIAPGTIEMRESRSAEFARPPQAYSQAAVTEVETVKPMAIPSFPPIPRWRLRKFLRPGFMLGILIALAFATIAIAAPVIAPPEGDDPYAVPKDGRLFEPQPPSRDHLLGTLEGQYDVFYGLVWGTRVALRIGLFVTLGRALIGVALGLISGYYGRMLDALIMRVTDAFMAVPIVPATMMMLVFFGPGFFARLASGAGGVAKLVVMVSLVLFGWMQYARIVRGNVLAEREKQYVQAAIAIGARSPRIIFRHVLPNIPQGLFVLIASDVGAMVVLATVFTFLGLSGARGTADWGVMLNVSRNWIVGTPSNAFQYWYTYIPPSMAIVLFSVGWNLIGDGLRDILDPRMQ